ncbi:MAG: hypothetical protein INR73_03710 [Williamsia sp.]|nr:hypothetical protein [Williamsia sp.]
MINVNELRFGNRILQKTANKISQVSFGVQHLELVARGDVSQLYPVVLKPEVVERCGFVENKQYPLLPEAREFTLLLPVQGGNNNQLYVYSKSNGECFGRATVNGLVASNNFYHLHQLQNLVYALTGEELSV